MPKQTLPKAVMTAVRRNAFRLAALEYPRLRGELENRALYLMNQPHATAVEVIVILDGNHVHTPAHCDACGHVGR